MQGMAGTYKFCSVMAVLSNFDIIESCKSRVFYEVTFISVIDH